MQMIDGQHGTLSIYSTWANIQDSRTPIKLASSC